MHQGTRKPGYVRAGCNQTDRVGVYFGGTRYIKLIRWADYAKELNV